MHIEKRLRRYKSRLKDHQIARGNGRSFELQAFGQQALARQAPDTRSADGAAVNAPSYVIAAPPNDNDEEVTEWNPVIIAESTAALKHLSVSEAVMELDMTGVPVIVFRHAGHGRVNLIYRRADGHIGWIDPPTIENNAH
jgi:hypothetical protein